MNFDEFFPHQVCINLDKRRDRWERMQTRFTEHGVDRVVRFSALDGRNLEIPPAWRYLPGAYGCLRSHLAVVEQARREGQPSVLIFEDDCVLAPGFKQKFVDYARQLPADWDMVFFGAIHGQPLTKVGDNIIRVSHSLSTYAYALKSTIYDGFVEVNRKALTVLDENTRGLQKLFNCYCFMPHLAWVEDDYSDVREERINLWWLKESLVLFSPEVDEVLRNTAIAISFRNCHRGSLRNLTFLVDYLHQTLPNITLLVLEQGTRPGLSQSDVPPYCRLEFLPDSGSGSEKSRFLKRGFAMFEASKEFFVFLDNDVFLTRDDIKANLLKCREYDFASSFREICLLNETETFRVLNGDARWERHNAGASRQKASIFDSSCIVTRNGMRILSGLTEWDNLESSVSNNLGNRLRVYDSPNPARLLSSG